ncbi:MAG: MFS transporter [Chloroflexi bacterium]|nr:MFS transporter [Chloroflexota bacterium]
MTLEPWRKNLYFVFAAEFIVIAGFNFVGPFTPLFIQELGSFSTDEAARWTGIALGGSGVAQFLGAPLWGIVADRWGRKPMVLRAMFGGTIILALLGLSPNVHYFVVFRAMQGVMTGTVAAASALVATSTPRNQVRYAMGLLMVAVFAGNTIGPLFGGIIADLVGFRAAFFITAFLLLIGGLLVAVFVKEDFEPPVERASLGSIWHMARSRAVLSLLLIVSLIHIAQAVVHPVISLYMKELNPEGAAATAAGSALALMGLISVASSFAAGRFGKRTSLRKLLAFSCIGTGLLYLPPAWAGTVGQLVVFIGLTGLLHGANLTSSSALVGLSVPVSQQGIAYGLAQSFTSLGNGLGPLIGGSLAPLLGLNHIFLVSAGLFVLAGLLVPRLLAPQPAR